MLHARFGGSTAARTINCAGWIGLSETLPTGAGSSSFADKGTLGHNALEEIFQNDMDPQDCLGMTYNDQVLDQEMLDNKILPAVAAAKEIFKTYGIDEWVCEERVELAGDAWGTSDLLGRGDGWTLILDWKLGFNPVSATENDQGLFYASAAYHTQETSDLFDDNDKVVIAIVQPSEKGEDYNCWETTTKRVKGYRKPFLLAVDEAKEPNAEVCAGSWCKYCPAVTICPAKSGDVQRALHMDPTQLGTLAEALGLADELKSWISDVEQIAHDQMENGAEVKGWKIVMKRAMRSWIDPEKAAKALARKLGGKKNVVKEVPLSPSQAEKLAKSQKVDLNMDAHIQSKSSGTTIAKSSDKRPAVLTASAAQAALATLQ